MTKPSNSNHSTTNNPTTTATTLTNGVANHNGVTAPRRPPGGVQVMPQPVPNRYQQQFSIESNKQLLMKCVSHKIFMKIFPQKISNRKCITLVLPSSYVYSIC